MENGGLMNELNVMRYLSFEINKDCNLSQSHPQCPINHPQRYFYGEKNSFLNDEIIINFWKWCRLKKGFRGIVMWHSYNEPTLVIDRIRYLMRRMKKVDPIQPFQLITNSKIAIHGFDLYKYTNYPDKQLDDRILSAKGEGHSYEDMVKINRSTGWCRRGFGWEMIIDYHGNLMLCCNDWRCEESVGNIFTHNWSQLLERFITKSKSIRWENEEEYYNLPRMCRSCMAHTNLYDTGGSF